MNGLIPQHTRQDTVFALIGDRPEVLPKVLRAAFSHKWVSTYQIGFGPPLLKSNERVRAALQGVTRALDKLDAYLVHCILDAVECRRLAELHRQLVTRRLGPVEAETVALASSDALQLELRVNQPGRPSIPVTETPPEALSARFLIRLSDPLNSRLLDVAAAAEAAKGLNDPWALELRAPASFRALYAMWIDELKESLESTTPVRTVDLGAPSAHARVIRNGERL
jgi:hypothetical protein